MPVTKILNRHATFAFSYSAFGVQSEITTQDTVANNVVIINTPIDRIKGKPLTLVIAIQV